MNGSSAGSRTERDRGSETSPLRRPVGELLRHWRERRRLSQLELSSAADISTRHLSFVETGRSRPSRDMIVRIAEHLEVPLRERNRILLAGGYAPVYPENMLTSPQMTTVRAAIGQVLKGHEPYPAVVVDRSWNLLDANAALRLFTDGVSPELITQPINVLRLALHPRGLAPRIVNLGEWRAHSLSRLHREIMAGGDADLADLHEELRGYPCDQPEPEIELTRAG